MATPSSPSPSHAPSEALTEARLSQALKQLRTPNSATPGQPGSLWQGLCDTLACSDSDLSTALSKYYGIATLGDALWATLHRLEPQADSNDLIWLGASKGAWLLCQDPWSTQASAALRRSPYPQAQLALGLPAQWALLASVQGSRAMSSTSTEAMAPNANNSAANSEDAAPSTNVVGFVDDAIARAYRDGASDIHFETSRKGLSVKYRLDGVMAPGESFTDSARCEEVISRIKVMAQLDITERRRPQDGRIHWSRAGHDSIDLRVSIMPSIFGEDAVLRLLDKAQLRHASQSISLDSLGFDEQLALTIRGLAARPHGMLLITGPTGSGKTTTVYAALSEVNDGLEKIVTIEDPVEYELPGVLQIPVNEQKGLTFATGLRSILRHDPDKILVGEIRDAETAEIAVQSSLTGHLVFTTVHANSLFDVLGRFQHFGIEPFALASALNGVVVQRLMRKLCPHCMQWRDTSAAEAHKFASLMLPTPAKLPVAQGCPHCRNTGYKGRFVLAEVHELSDTVRDLIVRRTSMSDLKATMYPDPNSRLVARAIAKVSLGITSLEEVTRVVGLV